MPSAAPVPSDDEAADVPSDDECGADDVDAAAVDAALERNVLRLLRKARVAVPSGLLTREQAWSLAHASEFVASTADEMVDPWDYVDDDGAPSASHGGAGPSGVAKEPVDMSDEE